MDDFDIENDLKINPYRLNEECVSHPGIYYRYADACADAKQNVSICKDKYEVVMAERELEIRKECSDMGKKTTENIIVAMVKSDSEVVDARNELREAEGIYAKLLVAVNAMDARRSELDNLTKLSVTNHFAANDSSVSESESDESCRRNIRKHMNNKED